MCLYFITWYLMFELFDRTARDFSCQSMKNILDNPLFLSCMSILIKSSIGNIAIVLCWQKQIRKLKNSKLLWSTRNNEWHWNVFFYLWVPIQTHMRIATGEKDRILPSAYLTNTKNNLSFMLFFNMTNAHPHLFTCGGAGTSYRLSQFHYQRWC